MEKLKRVLVFKNLAEQVVNGSPEGNKALMKVQIAANRVLKRLEETLEDLQMEMDHLKLKHSSVDRDGNVVKDEKGHYKYTKEEKDALDNELAKLMSKKVKFKPLFVEVPEGYPLSFVRAFEGFIFKESDYNSDEIILD